MNKTKKLTQGAMMLAIVGALMVIDRQLSYLFEELLTILMPVVIILYAAMYDLKDGAILSFGLLVMGFLFGSSYSYMYIPVGIIVAMLYSWGLKKNLDKQKLLLISMSYILGEVLVTYVVMPIFGVDVASMLDEMKTLLFDPQYGDLMSSMDTLSINIDSLLAIMYVITTIVMGVIEGFCIHLLSIFLLKRFKIRDIAVGSLLDMKSSAPVAYISMALMILTYLVRLVDVSSDVRTAVIAFGAVGLLILSYYGYVFFLLYGRIVMHRNLAVPVVLLTFLLLPYSMIILGIVGFLYGSGPLRNYLLSKRDSNMQ